DEIGALRQKDLLDVLGPVEEEGLVTRDSKLHEVAVFADAVGEEAQDIGSEIREASEQEAPPRSRRVMSRPSVLFTGDDRNRVHAAEAPARTRSSSSCLAGTTPACWKRIRPPLRTTKLGML